MVSKIDPTQINAAYPVAGTNQSSAGFRANFSAIQSCLSTAKSEISNMQATSISVTGDITNAGTTPALGQTSLSIPLNLQLKQVLNTTGSVDTSSSNVSFTVNQKGIITSFVATPKHAYVGSATTNFSVTKNSLDATYPDSTGIQSISVPILTIDGYGNVISQATNVLTGFGLLGYAMPKGGILTGSSINVSTFVKPGASGQFLVSDPTTDTGLRWESVSFGTSVNSIATGAGLVITGANTDPTISVDISPLPEVTTITDTDSIIMDRAGEISKATFSDIANMYLDGKFLKSVASDTTPSLGGNLNVGIYGITSTTDLSLASGSTGNIILDGVSFPNTVPTANSILVVDKTGKGTWQNYSSGLGNVTPKNGIGITTNSTTGNSTIQLDYSNMTNATTSFNRGASSVVVYDSTSKSTIMIPLSDLDTEMSGIIYVSGTIGSDTSGDGSVGNPYATIQQSINKSVQNTTIIIMPGTYVENINVTVDNLYFKSYIDSFTTTIVGTCQIGNATVGSLKSTTFDGITFESFSGPSITTGPYNDEISFTDCIFNADQSSDIMLFTGSLSSRVDITNCTISGVVTNSFTSGVVQIDGTKNIDGYEMRLVLNSGSTTIVDNMYSLLSVTHNGGILVMNNINRLFDTYNSIADTSGLNPSGYVYPTFTSTSDSASDMVILKNVGLYHKDYGCWGQINKSGSCNYLFDSVDRFVAQDTTSGTGIYPNKTIPTAGQVAELPELTGTTYTLTPYERTYSVTINTDMTLTVATPPYQSNYHYEYDFRLITVGTGFGSLTFDTSVTATSGIDLSMDTTANAYTMFDFRWIPYIGSWLCIGKYTLNAGGTSFTNLTQMSVGSPELAANGRGLGFLTSGEAKNYDSRIYASGGSATDGAGDLEIQSKNLTIDGQLNINNTMINFGLNQSAAGATLINFFSNGDNTAADALVQSYGGSTDGSAYGGTLTLKAANVTVTAPYIDMSSAENGVIVPVLTQGDDSQKAASTTWCNSKFCPTITSGTQDPVTNFYYDTTNAAPQFNSAGWSGYLVQASAAADDYSCTAIGVTKGTSTPYFYQLGNGKVNLAVASSSAKLKTNIADTIKSTTDALSDINNIPLKSFNWISTNRKVDMGIIAEELEKVCPQLIDKNSDADDDHASVNMLNLMARMIGAIQELSKKVDDLEKKLSS